MLLEFCLDKELCVSNIWLKIWRNRKVTFTLGRNKTEIDFMLIRKEHQPFLDNVKGILGQFQHATVLADIDIYGMHACECCEEVDFDRCR